MKIFLVNWATCHDGFVYNGSIPCLSMEEARMELDKLKKQSGVQVKPAGYEEADENSYYLEQQGNSDNWERGEIVTKRLFGDAQPVVMVSSEDIMDFGIAPRDAEITEEQVEEVAARMSSYFSDSISEALHEACEAEGIG